MTFVPQCPCIKYPKPYQYEFSFSVHDLMGTNNIFCYIESMNSESYGACRFTAYKINLGHSKQQCCYDNVTFLCLLTCTGTVYLILYV